MRRELRRRRGEGGTRMIIGGNETVLVQGITGKQGTFWSERMREYGTKVVGGVNPRRAGERHLDLPVWASAQDAAKDQKIDAAVMFVPPFGVKDAALDIVAAGIRKIVWNTTGPIVPVVTGNPSIDIRRDILAALENSGIPFVALQPTVYMENFLLPFIAGEVATKDTLAYPMPEAVQCQWISHIDAASFSVAAFKRESSENLVLEISGPEKLSGPEIAERFGKALGRSISFRPMPPKEFGASLSYGDDGASVTSYYEQVFANPAIMTTNVDYRRAIDLLPIAPTSVEDFARINANQFSWS